MDTHWPKDKQFREGEWGGEKEKERARQINRGTKES